MRFRERLGLLSFAGLGSRFSRLLRSALQSIASLTKAGRLMVMARLIEALRVKRVMRLVAARRMLRLVRTMAAVNVFSEMLRAEMVANCGADERRG